MRAQALSAVAGSIRTLVTCIEECTGDTADASQARLEALLTEIDECLEAHGRSLPTARDNDDGERESTAGTLDNVCGSISRLLFSFPSSWTRALAFRMLRKLDVDISHSRTRMLSHHAPENPYVSRCLTRQELNETGRSNVDAINLMLCAAIDGAGDGTEQLEALSLVRRWCAGGRHRLVHVQQRTLVAVVALAKTKGSQVHLSAARALATEIILASSLTLSRSTSTRSPLSRSLGMLLDFLMQRTIDECDSPADAAAAMRSGGTSDGRCRPTHMATFAVLRVLSSVRGRRDGSIPASLAAVQKTPTSTLQSCERSSKKKYIRMANVSVSTALSPLLEELLNLAIDCRDASDVNAATASQDSEDGRSCRMYKCLTALTRIAGCTSGFLALACCSRGSRTKADSSRSALGLLSSTLFRTRNLRCQQSLLDLFSRLARFRGYGSGVDDGAAGEQQGPRRSAAPFSSSCVLGSVSSEDEVQLFAFTLYNLHAVGLPSVLMRMALRIHERRRRATGADYQSLRRQETFIASYATALLSHIKAASDVFLPKDVADEISASDDAADELSRQAHPERDESASSRGDGEGTDVAIRATTMDSRNGSTATNDRGGYHAIVTKSQVDTIQAASASCAGRMVVHGQADIMSDQFCAVHTIMDVDTETLLSTRSNRFGLIPDTLPKAADRGGWSGPRPRPATPLCSEGAFLHRISTLLSVSKVLAAEVQEYRSWQFTAILMILKTYTTRGDDVVRRLMRNKQFLRFMTRLAMLFSTMLGSIAAESDAGVLLAEILEKFTRSLLATPRGVAFLAEHGSRSYSAMMESSAGRKGDPGAAGSNEIGDDDEGHTGGPKHRDTVRPPGSAFFNVLQKVTMGLIFELHVTAEDEFFYAQQVRDHRGGEGTRAAARSTATMPTGIKTSRIFHPLSLSESRIGCLISCHLMPILSDVRHRRILTVEDPTSRQPVSVLTVIERVMEKSNNSDLHELILSGVIKNAGTSGHFPGAAILSSALRTRNARSFALALRCCRDLLLSSRCEDDEATLNEMGIRAVAARSETATSATTPISVFSEHGGFDVDALLRMDTHRGMRNALEAIYGFIEEVYVAPDETSGSATRSNDADSLDGRKIGLVRSLLAEVAALSPIVSSCLGAELGRRLPYTLVDDNCTLDGGARAVEEAANVPMGSQPATCITSALALAIAGTPVGYGSLCRHGWLFSALESWKRQLDEYPSVIEASAFFGKLLGGSPSPSAAWSTGRVHYPLHLFGRLALTEEGCGVLSGLASDEVSESLSVLDRVPAVDCSASSVASSVWLVCHLCASPLSFVHLNESDRLRSSLRKILLLGTQASDLVVRSHCLCALGMACRCPETREVLSACGWMTTSVRIPITPDFGLRMGVCLPAVAYYDKAGIKSRTQRCESSFLVLPSQSVMSAVSSYAEHLQTLVGTSNRKNDPSEGSAPVAHPSRPCPSELDAVLGGGGGGGGDGRISEAALRCLRGLSDLQNPVLEDEARCQVAVHLRDINDDGLLRDGCFQRCLPLLLEASTVLSHAMRRETYRFTAFASE